MKIIGMTEDKIVIFIDEDLNFHYAYLEDADSTIRNYGYMYDWYDTKRDEYDPEFELNLCDAYDCPPDELPGILASEAVEDEVKAMEELNCLDTGILNINGTDYIFVSADSVPLNKSFILDKVILTVDANLLNDNLTEKARKRIKELDNKETLRKVLENI